jgi:hypothetical protein
MIRFQNDEAMVLASALMRGIHPLDVHRFECYQGAGELQLRQSHRKNQEVNLLFVSILWPRFFAFKRSPSEKDICLRVDKLA